MTKLMETIINRLRQIPEADQDKVASEVEELLEDFPTHDEVVTIAEGRAAYERGDIITLEQLEHEMELGTD